MYPARNRGRDNPYISTLSQALEESGVRLRHFDPLLPRRPAQALHVHWPERVFHNRTGSRFAAAARYYAQNLLASMRATRHAGGRVVWTAHNLAPHDAQNAAQAVVWRDLREEFFALVSDVATLSDGARAPLIAALPTLANARFHTVMHQHFIEYFAETPRHDVRALHGIPNDAIVFASLGYLKAYKRVAEMISAFREADLPNAYLLLAGRISASYRAQLAEACKGDPRIKLLAGAFEDADLVSILSTAQASVFNFAGQFNSGSLITSLSLGAPVLCPKFPAGSELASMVGPDWMLEVDTALSADDFESAAKRFATRQPGDMPKLDALAPLAVAARHKRAYGIN